MRSCIKAKIVVLRKNTTDAEYWNIRDTMVFDREFNEDLNLQISKSIDNYRNSVTHDTVLKFQITRYYEDIEEEELDFESVNSIITRHNF